MRFSDATLLARTAARQYRSVCRSLHTLHLHSNVKPTLRTLYRSLCQEEQTDIPHAAFSNVPKHVIRRPQSIARSLLIVTTPFGFLSWDWLVVAKPLLPFGLCVTAANTRNLRSASLLWPLVARTPFGVFGDLLVVAKPPLPVLRSVCFVRVGCRRQAPVVRTPFADTHVTGGLSYCCQSLQSYMSMFETEVTQV